MLKSINWILPFRAALFVALASFGMASCAEELKIQEPPVAQPINLGREGVVAKFDIKVKEHRIYNFAIRFRYPEEDQNERFRIRKIIGGHELDKNNNSIDPGVLTPVKITIARKQTHSGLIVYQKTITPILTSWGGDAFAKGSASFTKAIGHCDLAPGEYTVLLESLAHPKEYESIPTYLLIGMDKFKTSFDIKNIDRSKACPQ